MTIFCDNCKKPIAEWKDNGRTDTSPNVVGDSVLCSCGQRMSLERFNKLKMDAIVRTWQKMPPTGYYIHLTERL